MKTRVLDLLVGRRRLSAILLVGAAAWLPSIAVADDFSGDYRTLFSFDNDIFDQVQISSSLGDLSITPGATSSDLNLWMSLGSSTISLPLVVSGNMATLPYRSFDTGTATALDLVLLSNGNNMALAYVEQARSGAISFSISQWQKTTDVATADQLPQTSLATAWGDSNLRSLGDGFDTDPGPIALTIEQSPLSVTHEVMAKVTLPLAQNANGVLYATGTPVTTAESVVHLFEMLYDTSGFGSLISVTSELNDPTDVSVSVGLISPVPEPETWAMLGVGLALLSLRRRSLVEKPASQP